MRNGKNNKAFTLVELAIVITIIGLLIGGVLKGQELLENARLTAAVNQIKAAQAGAITFKDIYKALPGEIVNPANFIQNCTTVPCNISGNGDGRIGQAGTAQQTYAEHHNFWIHMERAGVMTGFTQGTGYNGWAISYPSFPLGGSLFMEYETVSNFNAQPPNNMLRMPANAGGVFAYLSHSSPQTVFMKLDLKADDGKPWTGDYTFDDDGSDAAPTNAFDPNIHDILPYTMRSGL